MTPQRHPRHRGEPSRRRAAANLVTEILWATRWAVGLAVALVAVGGSAVSAQETVVIGGSGLPGIEVDLGAVDDLEGGSGRRLRLPGDASGATAAMVRRAPVVDIAALRIPAERLTARQRRPRTTAPAQARTAPREPAKPSQPAATAPPRPRQPADLLPAEVRSKPAPPPLPARATKAAAPPPQPATPPPPVAKAETEPPRVAAAAPSATKAVKVAPLPPSPSAQTTRKPAPPPPPARVRAAAPPSLPPSPPPSPSRAAPPPPPPKTTVAPPAVIPAPKPPSAVASLPVASLPAGGGLALRIEFSGASARVSRPAQERLERLVPAVIASDGRLQLKAYAGKTPETASTSRRLSLDRALTVRRLLIEQGVKSTRIDVRALGVADDRGPAERVDVVYIAR